MNEVTKSQKIWLVVSEIPEGKVATYGQVAELAGYPRGARVVGNVLAQLPAGSHLPWHRVLNYRGEIAFPHDSSRHQTQKKRLEREGIIFINSRLALAEYRWDGITR